MTLEETVKQHMAGSSIAGLWRLVEVMPDGSTIETPEEIDPRVLREELFLLREIAQAIYRESVDMLSPDETLHLAMAEYLGQGKSTVLIHMYGENIDQLTEEAVCAAKLGVLKPRGASCRFEATEALLAGVRALAEEKPPACYEPATPELEEWDRALRLGWLDALPMEFYLTRLGAWEIDEMLARRCVRVLADLARMFPAPVEQGTAP